MECFQLGCFLSYPKWEIFLQYTHIKAQAGNSATSMMTQEDCTLEPGHEIASQLQRARKKIICFYNYIVTSILDSTFATSSNQALPVFCSCLVPCYPFIVAFKVSGIMHTNSKKHHKNCQSCFLQAFSPQKKLFIPNKGYTHVAQDVGHRILLW
jgi:hypothetical protein